MRRPSRLIGCLVGLLLAACAGDKKDQAGTTGSAGLAAGTSHTCALANGAVRCWGQNASGQLGTGTFTTSSLSPRAVSGISTATAIVAGGDHTCGVLPNGTAQCWGRNDSGQLGNGSLTSAASPGQVSDLTTVAILAAGDLHTCALLANGAVTCWGSNTKGQLGNASLATATTPTAFTGFLPVGTTATALAAGGEHTCAVLSDGTVNCWGKNDLGQLGNGTFNATAATSTPQEVKEIGILTTVPRATAVAVGANHSCALLANATVRCWGSNGNGRLGATTATPSPCGDTACSTTPLAVSGISTAIAIAAGGSHTCVRLLDNTLTCWGLNGSGQLGNDTVTSSTSPVTVTGISTATTFAAGSFHTCVRLSDSVVKCWGKNDAGQLGDGTVTSAKAPVAVITTF